MHKHVRWSFPPPTITEILAGISGLLRLMEALAGASRSLPSLSLSLSLSVSVDRMGSQIWASAMVELHRRTFIVPRFFFFFRTYPCNSLKPGSGSGERREPSRPFVYFLTVHFHIFHLPSVHRAKRKRGCGSLVAFHASVSITLSNHNIMSAYKSNFKYRSSLGSNRRPPPCPLNQAIDHSRSQLHSRLPCHRHRHSRRLLLLLPCRPPACFSRAGRSALGAACVRLLLFNTWLTRRARNRPG